MNETMPDISFERSMNHNYMILHKCDFFGKGQTGQRITAQGCCLKTAFRVFCL